MKEEKPLKLSSVRKIVLVTKDLMIQAVLVGAPLFITAKTTEWPSATRFVSNYLIGSFALSLWTIMVIPSLMVERANPIKKGQKLWDKLLLLLLLILFEGWLVFQTLDSYFYHWSFPMPSLLQNTAGPLLIINFWFLLWSVRRENHFLSGAVHIQSDRGQTVITTGPYAVIRHPMYASMLFLIIGTAMMLNSAWGIVVGLLWFLLLAVRSIWEERELLEQLQGYALYMQKVKYRLIPHIW